MTRMRRLTAKEVETLLKKYGFELVSQKGSHHKWRNYSLGLQVTVPSHGNKILPIGTLRSILINANIPESQWKE